MNHLERALDNQNQWWKYLVVFLVGFVGANIIGGIPLMIVMLSKMAASNGELALDPDNMMDLTALGIDSNLGLVLLLLPLATGLFAIALMFKPLHRRTVSEVINGTDRIRWGRFFSGLVIWGCIMVLMVGIDFILNPANFEVRFHLNSFLILVAVSLLLIPLQTTFEEVLFRGYLAQGVGAWTRNRWLVLFIPAILFGLVHVGNPEVKAYGFWIAMPQYIAFGLLFGLTSILDDGIEIAMGAHAINNIMSSILITSEASALQTHALLKQQNVDPARDLWILLLANLIFLSILAYRYGWRFKVLNERIEEKRAIPGGEESIGSATS